MESVRYSAESFGSVLASYIILYLNHIQKEPEDGIFDSRSILYYFFHSLFLS